MQSSTNPVRDHNGRIEKVKEIRFENSIEDGFSNGPKFINVVKIKYDGCYVSENWG